MALIETPTGNLYYEICDLTPPWIEQPQTIVFHHGVAGHPAMWNGWLASLMHRYRIVRYDLRGHARSDMPGAGFNWSFDALVDDLLRVADAAGAEQFHLVGESIGGTAGIACALSHQQRLRSLTLSNASPRGGLLGNVNIWRDMIDADGQKKWAEQMMQWRFHDGALDEATFRWYLALHESCSVEVCLALADLLLGIDYSDQIERIEMPTLLLSPDDSPFIPATVMLGMHEAIKGSEIQVFAHSRHGLPLSHGAACAGVLADFLARRT